MSVMGCRGRQGVKNEIFVINSIVNTLSQLVRACKTFLLFVVWVSSTISRRDERNYKNLLSKIDIVAYKLLFMCERAVGGGFSLFLSTKASWKLWPLFDDHSVCAFDFQATVMNYKSPIFKLCLSFKTSYFAATFPLKLNTVYHHSREKIHHRPSQIRVRAKWPSQWWAVCFTILKKKLSF